MLNCLFCVFKEAKDMQVSTIENREDYVSIKELVDLIDKKYILHLHNSKKDVDKLAKLALEKKIISTIKKENNIDYIQENRGKKVYLINRGSINALMNLLEKYIISRPQFTRHDEVLYSKQLAKISDGSQKDKTLKELQIQKSSDYLEGKSLENAKNCIIQIIDNNLYNTTYDSTRKVVEKIEEFAADSYDDFAEAFKIHFNQAFGEKLTYDLNKVKTEIIFQNSFKQKYSSFNQIAYIKDYCLRELHTVKYDDTFIIIKGYSEYDIKLQNPLTWYCRK